MVAYKMAAVKVTPPNDFPLGLIRSHMIVIHLFLMLCDLQRVVRDLCPTLYTYNTIICTHEGWGGVWRKGRSWGSVFPFDVYIRRQQHSTVTLRFVRRAIPGARRATEPREGPSPVTPNNASYYFCCFKFWLCMLNFELTCWNLMLFIR